MFRGFSFLIPYALWTFPSVPPPAGILAMRAVGHQATLCEKTTECGACGDLPACATAMKDGALFPVVFSSKDKHAGYVEKDTCNPFLACLDSCKLAPTSAKPPMVHAGEPDAPLVSNLTTQGFIHAANGWTEQELFDVNPWEPEKDFGGAGNVAGDLVDLAFVPPACPSPARRYDGQAQRGCGGGPHVAGRQHPRLRVSYRRLKAPASKARASLAKAANNLVASTLLFPSA